MSTITKTIGNITVNFQEEKFSKTNAYKRLDAVTEDGMNWFIAKKNVPENIDITNTNYWYNFISFNDVVNNIKTSVNEKIISEEKRATGVENQIKSNLSTFNEQFISHVTDNDNPHNVTKEQLELENVDNTSDISKPVSTVQQKAIDIAYANSNAYTDQKIADLINGAPETLDTLKEVAAAIEENKTVAEALNNSIGKKANQSELDTHTGNDVIHITNNERTDWTDANNKKHEHSNKNTLDNITPSDIVNWNNVGNKLDKIGDSSDVTNTINTASSRDNLSTGEKLSISLGKIKKWFTDLKAVAFTGSYNDLENVPETFIPSNHKQAFTASECTDYATDDNTLGVTPAAVKKAIGIFDPKSHTHSMSEITDFSGGSVDWKSFFLGSWNYLSTQPLTIEKSELRHARNIRLTFGSDTAYMYVYETAVASWFGTGTTSGYRIVVPFVSNNSELDEIVSFLHFYVDDSAIDEVVLTFVKGLSVGKDVQVAEITATSCVDNGIPPITQIEYCE